MPTKRFRVDPAELVVPDTAWPTVIVFAAGLALWAVPIYLYWQYGAPQSWWTIIPSSAAIFVLFTPMHDAAHRAVSRKYRWLNEAVGWVCSLVFLSGFWAFRYVHLQHHKFTNDPQRDPDYWSGAGPTILKPIRWGIQTFHYYIPFIEAANAGVIPRYQVKISYSVPVLLLVFLIAMAIAGYGIQVLRLWVVPVLIASFLLAYTFDYIPHRPHSVTRNTNIYKCTNKVDGFLTEGDGVDLSIPLLYQTYHNVHHLYPQVPFYRYIVIWRNYRDKFIEHGTPIVAAYSRNTPWL